MQTFIDENVLEKIKNTYLCFEISLQNSLKKLTQMINDICDKVEDNHQDILVFNLRSNALYQRIDIHNTTIKDINRWERAVRKLEKLNTVTVGAVSHNLSGPLFDIFLALDYRLSLNTAQFILPAGQHQIWPGMLLYRLSQQVGWVHTKRLMLENKAIQATKAYDIGIIDKIVDELTEATFQQVIAELRYAANSEYAVRRQLLSESQHTSYEEALGVHLAACDRAIRANKNSVIEDHVAKITIDGMTKSRHFEADDKKRRIRERFELIVNGPALFNAVVAGMEFGIFKFLSQQSRSSFDAILQVTQLRCDKLRVLLHALCSTELIEKENSLYFNSDLANDLLVDEGEASWAHVLLGWQKIYYPAFMHTTDALRKASNTALDLENYAGTEPTLYQRLPHNPPLQKIFHAAMSAFTLQSIDDLIDNQEFESVHHLLDIGGNDGTTATRLIKKYSQLDITIFDLPSVTKVASDYASGDIGNQRIKLCPGDLFTDPFPRGVDTVLFSHVLEIFSEDQIIQLLQKAYDVLPLGGKVLIYGYNVSDDETEGLYSARLSLYLNVLASGEGMAYPAKDWEKWCEKVGFQSVVTYKNLSYEHGLTVGYKK